jgi:hypothetical protein
MKGESMPLTPNYKLERLEREPLTTAKKAAPAEARKERKAQSMPEQAEQ